MKIVDGKGALKQVKIYIFSFIDYRNSDFTLQKQSILYFNFENSVIEILA